ncbi:hypothetical protein JCM10908_000590 [Rhodotorula pacifica]|uniref:DNA-directed DNA polymerase gamma MIP1 n=1 Tax=Rhodotorula pacifica TaxID=1495444 RepID=UPI003174A4AD
MSSSSRRRNAETIDSIPRTPLNEAHVPLISPKLRAQLFPPLDSPWAPPRPDPKAVKLSLEHLRHHQLLPDTAVAATTPSRELPQAVEFDLPPLEGETISHHFHALGRDVAEPYLSMAKDYAKAEVPPMPVQQHWTLTAGWTVYHPDGSFESVPYPPEDEASLVFDVETLPYTGGHFPIMAVAAGTKGWYGWCSPWLTGDDDMPNHLIPFGPASEPSPPSSADSVSSSSTLVELPDTKPRLLIGHNVLFDRARIAQEYSLRRPSSRYIDTLSLHVAVSGLTNPQRPQWLKYRKGQEATEAKGGVGAAAKAVVEAAAGKKEGVDEPETDPPKKSILNKLGSKGRRGVKKAATADADETPKDWKEVSSMNSLAEVARLHCGIKVDKALRDVLIDPTITIHDVREHFSELIDYCARDVETTLHVYRALLPKFLESCPHPVSFAGVALMTQPILPVDRHWPEYLERAETEYQHRLEGVSAALRALAEEARAKFGQTDEETGRFVWEADHWLRQLDWSPKKARRLPRALRAKLRGKQEELEAAANRTTSSDESVDSAQPAAEMETRSASVPTWRAELDKATFDWALLPLLLETTWRGFPVVYSLKRGWLFAVPAAKLAAADVADAFEAQEAEVPVHPSELGPRDKHLLALLDVQLFTIPPRKGAKSCKSLLSKQFAKEVANGTLASPHRELSDLIGLSKAQRESSLGKHALKKVVELADAAVSLPSSSRDDNVWLRQLDWTVVETTVATQPAARSAPSKARSDAAEVAAVLKADGIHLETGRHVEADELVWPKWYWDLDSASKGLDVSIGKRATPLLLKLQWKGFPLAYSKEHGWCYRMTGSAFDEISDASLKPLTFSAIEDVSLADDEAGYYFKLPHPDGESKNVGSPLSKSFVSAFEDGLLTSEYPAARDALQLNASCSYWKSSRERITEQMVVWEGDARQEAPTAAAIASAAAKSDTLGLILPQVVPMGTITRRAVERTWLTASNAKKNRVGSELKSMVRAPAGYAIVGADVDSEELWICSVMGDAQFGIHGATAIGWMTLEGTKSAGTDLHSKSASILGISRDAAKVFNYSRIYGAGVKHAVQLLLKSNPGLSKDEATALAKNLYQATKGLKDRSNAFRRQFWYGGTESFVFNKLEGIAQSEQPRTPALGCGLTSALTKAHLLADGENKAGEGFLPSRVNWVVQSSGVDYLHLLLVSMEYLTKRYGIDARYLISVHDEIRYLVKEEDKYRAALALQIANLWTRSLFAYRLQMPDLPQGCAFFSAVDIDSCFRKEVNMPCVTPSNPEAIPFGESLDIEQTLVKTGGRLGNAPHAEPLASLVELSHEDVQGEQHRVSQLQFLQAQTATSSQEIKHLWDSVQVEKRHKAGIVTSPSAASVRRINATDDVAAKSPRRSRKRLDDDYDVSLMPQLFEPARPKRPSRPSSSGALTPEDLDLDEPLPEAEDDFDLALHRPISRMQL